MKTDSGQQASAPASATGPSTVSLEDLSKALDGCLLVDQPRFRKSFQRLHRRAAKNLPIDRGLARLSSDVNKSQRVADHRRDLPINLACPPELPVSARREEIAAAIAEHPVLILCGDTGSGKTTQLPKICLALGRGVLGRIAHTQPRRLAARAAAARIAKETGTTLGAAIGYAVRFDERMAEQTRVKLMTDGILLNEIHHDPKLLQYDTIIIDEAHERSLNIDFLLGYIRRLLPQRPDLKVIITSATLDPERLSAHFGNAPILKVEGRTYPVTVRFEPPDPDDDVADSVARTVAGLPPGDDDAGDVLVFLPGERQIRETARALGKHPDVSADILPLLARLSAQEQDRVFSPGARQRVILATNIAETSLTVPRIRYVIDTGTARVKRYSAKARIEQLGIEPVSQASANQRMGRCGRLRDGVCIRLYDEDEFADRPAFTDPEIVRSNLASVILKMAILGLGDIEKFAFVDPPHPRYIRDGYRLLRELGAVDAKERVTATGRRMARLPVDPQFARIVLAAPEHHCLREILTIVSGLSVQDPRERPLDRQAAADESHAQRHDAKSDFMALLTLWQDYRQAARLGASKLRRWCREQFLSAHRMREWRDVRRQLADVAKDLSLARNDEPADYAAVHRALLAGLPAHVGFHEQRGDYRGVRNSQFRLFPGSGVAAKKPKWVVCSELVLTGRLYGRTVAAVKPRWIEMAAAHLLKRTVSEPAWSPHSGEVDALETVSLQGLVLASRRRVRFAAVDRAGARQIFVEQALVPMAPEIKAPFNQHNRALMKQVRGVEARLRRPGLIDDNHVRRFFERELPESVTGRRELYRWLKADSAARNDALSLSADELGVLPVADPAAYPEVIEWQGNVLPVRYRFDPRDADDGATVDVPVALLLELPAAVTEWGVPAWLEDKVIAVIRQLPKPLRKHFVPVPDTAARFLADINAAPAVSGTWAAGQGFYGTLARWLSDQAGAVVKEDDLASATLPAYLEMHLRILGENGEVLTTGNDLNALKMRLAGAAKAARTTGAADGKQPRFTAWDFGPLTGVVRSRQDGLQLTRYPALADLGNSVRLESRDSAAAAHRVTTDGIIRLFRLRFSSQSRYIEQRLLPKQEGELLAVRLGGIKALAQDLAWLTFKDVFLASVGSPITDREGFDEAASRFGSELVQCGSALSETVIDILRAHHALRMKLPDPAPAPQAAGIADVEAQLDDLLGPGFLRRTPVEWLQCYPRYLKAAGIRVRRLPDRIQQDAAAAETIRQWMDRWRALTERAQGDAVGACEELRWMIEEYRVSLFAQGLGTRFPVSEKRLERLAIRAGR